MTKSTFLRLSAVLAWLGLLPSAVFAANPLWIWHGNNGAAIQTNETRFFRKTFDVPGKVSKAMLTISADDDAVVYLNGKQMVEARDFSKPSREDVTKEIKKGENVIAIRGHNADSDVAGVALLLELKANSKQSEYLVSDATWRSSDKEEPGWEKAQFNDRAWSKAVSKGKMGDQPWGDVLKIPKATAAESLTVLPGFKVELLHSSEVGEGSWICMTTDNKGRLIISPQADTQPLLRVTLTKSGQVAKIEPIPAPVHQAMGLLYAYDSLYVNGHGPKGTGLYRLIDANHNDRFDTNEVQFLKTIEGEGEHGYHGLVLGPDKMIYMMNGNHTKVPKGIAETSPHTHYEEDFLLARQWDAGGHAVGILAPGGYVVRTDSEGKKWELMLAGFRNAYDLDFNAEGELFTFDSDMEWDWGLPWYRPTRINHCVKSAEFGWRSGSAVWPKYYADSLPATLDIGVGSPTGVKFGTKSNFSEKYRKAFFVLDWSYGRIFAVHLHPDGASYTGDKEVFVKGKPLSVTDLDFGKDGAMYFITGGRGTQSGLYRVSQTGKGSRSKEMKGEAESARAGERARELRRRLEAFHGKKDPRAVDFAWPYLGSEDRFIRFAARIAVEWQDVSLWKARAVNEKEPRAALTALLALARCGGKDTQRDLLLALKKFPTDSLPLDLKLDKLRVIELSLIRQGKPEADLVQLAIQKLNQLYPADDEFMNRELSQILIYLEAPEVVTKTLALLDKARTQEEQAHYMFYLRNLKTGWSLEQRKHYFEWFRFAQEAAKGDVSDPAGSPYNVWSHQRKANQRHPFDLLNWFTEAGREYADGASYPKYLVNFRKDAIEALSSDDRIALSSWVTDYSSVAAHKVTRDRSFVKEWTMADLEPALSEASAGRSFSKGKAAFNDGQCLLCHRFGNEGGSIGPELTAASSKYSRHDILESILEPSKVVSEQFQDMTIVRKNGESETGRVVDETPDKVVVQASLLAPARVEILKSEIAERRPSKLSPMPVGLVNQFTKEEILDLLAYIESAGKEKAANFKVAADAKP